MERADRIDLLGEANVQAWADELGATQQNTSKHLQALWRAGVVTRRQQGRVSVYRLADREALALIERTATTIAEQLREIADVTSDDDESDDAPDS
ncbi:MAG: hypothetical protein ACREX8_10105 [Gammaproteobacteria bacterium]